MGGNIQSGDCIQIDLFRFHACLLVNLVFPVFSAQDVDTKSHFCPYEADVRVLTLVNETYSEVKTYQNCDDFPESQIISREELSEDSIWCTVNV